MKPFSQSRTYSFNSDIEANPDQPESVRRTAAPDPAQAEFMSNPKYMSRRGSKSLPASPMGSPKSIRRGVPNPYFTGHFTSDASSAAVTSRTGGGGSGSTATLPPPVATGWFLSSLLGLQRDVTNSTTSVVSNISEEAEEAIEQQSHNGGKIGGTNTNGSQTVLKAKPSELREMNFWSPTSM